MSNWTKTTDHCYDPEYVKCDVYVKQINRGKVYLMDNKKDSFTYTVSCGANSDRSFTGCFFGDGKIKTVQDAMAALDKETF